MPFIHSLFEVPRNSLGLWFGAFISAALSATVTEARKQTGSFVFIQLRLPFLAPGIQTLVSSELAYWQ